MNRYEIARGEKPEPVKTHRNNFEDASTECTISLVKKETMSARGLSFHCELLSLKLRLDLKKFSYDIDMKVHGPHDLCIEADNPFLMSVHGQEFTVIPTGTHTDGGIIHVYGWTEGCKFKRIKGIRENITRSSGSVPALGIRGNRRIPRGSRGFTGIAG